MQCKPAEFQRISCQHLFFERNPHADCCFSSAISCIFFGQLYIYFTILSVLRPVLPRHVIIRTIKMHNLAVEQYKTFCWLITQNILVEVSIKCLLNTFFISFSCTHKTTLVNDHLLQNLKLCITVCHSPFNMFLCEFKQMCNTVSRPSLKYVLNISLTKECLEC